MSEKLPITKEGFEALKEQLRHLTQVERPKIVRDIEVARSYGDLKENAEYHAAKEKQGMIEAKINKLNADLATSEVIDISRMAGNSIKFGALVKFINNDTEEEQMYRIVGPAESDAAQNKISVTSPIGKALIGKQVGDEVEIRIPKGVLSITVSSISYK